MTPPSPIPLLRVRHLRTYFDTEDGVVKAVNDVNFRMETGRTFALVGESGCGKSVTAFSILRLLPMPPAVITSRRFLDRLAEELPRLAGARRDKALRLAGGGLEEAPSANGGPARFRVGAPSEVLLEGTDLLDLSEGQMRQVRGGQVGMVFQEPMSSLNPVFTCGAQIVEAIRLHQRVSGAASRDLAIEMLSRVGIPEPAQRFREYPHQMSGGMRQRVMIAMALSCNPRLLIADEPTTALDVTIQAQILDLLKELQAKTGLAILLITHDLAVVAETAHTVAVMYASQIVEYASAGPLFNQPLHPYTQALFRSLPRLGQQRKRLETIGGSVPNPLEFPAGCKFHPRCPQARDICRAKEPTLREVQPGHWAACWVCPGYDSAKETDSSDERS
jgi:oligopeptide/dipeptide ABC transporter ATP-binding protein